MGFFGNMRSINKIYRLLEDIEPLMATLLDMAQSNSSDRQLMVALSGKIRILLNELISINKNAGNTVRCADFQFMGGKHRIDYIIAVVSEIIGVVR